MSATPLPPSTDFTEAEVTEGQFKTAISSLRAYLSFLFGTDGEKATARTALGLANGATTTVGTAATKDVGVNAGNVVELAAGGKLPAVDGSELTGIITTPPADSITAAMLKTGNNERDWVLARTAAAAVGAVGTYALLAGLGDWTEGSTYAGSNLYAWGSHASGTQWPQYSTAWAGAQVSGTWRAMGRSHRHPHECGNCRRMTLFLRIA